MMVKWKDLNHKKLSITLIIYSFILTLVLMFVFYQIDRDIQLDKEICQLTCTEDGAEYFVHDSQYDRCICDFEDPDLIDIEYNINQLWWDLQNE